MFKHVMIAQSCGIYRQCIFLVLLIFNIVSGSGIRNTLLFHFLPLTSYRLCLPDVFFLTAKRQCGPAGWGMFLVCQPTTAGLITEHTEEGLQGVQAVPPYFYPFPKAGSKTSLIPVWPMAFLSSRARNGYKASALICKDVGNIYPHLVENSCLNLLGSNPFQFTEVFLVLFILRRCFFIVLQLSHPCASITYVSKLYPVCDHM